jgi:NAD(P)-dependent dehydrogenase (short-subunit alcohol dehydrogenase family)
LLDVTDSESIEAAAAETRRALAERRETGLAALVNNAGVAIAGPLEFLPLDAIRDQLEINVVGQIAVTQAFLPLLRAARGRVLFVSSIAGRSAMPFVGAYSASKFALEAVADALRVELDPWRIPVVLIEPGVIETPIWETALAAAQRNLDRMPPATFELYGGALNALQSKMGAGVKGLTPDAVARVIERVLIAPRPRARYVVGNAARARLLLEHLPVRWRDAVVSAGVRRLLR